MLKNLSIKIFLFLREFFFKFFIGRIKMIKYENKYYPINFFLPYIFYIVLEQAQVKYVYLNDNIYFYQDYLFNDPIFPPLLSFTIDGKNMMSNIKNFKGNVPLTYFLYENNIIKPKQIDLSYWVNGSIKVKNIKNIEIYNYLKDIFD